MRLDRLCLFLLLSLLVGCKLLPPSDGQTRPTANVGTNLEEAVGGEESAAPSQGIRPKPRPATTPETAPETVPPEPAVSEPVVAELEIRISKEQATCEKQGGRWGEAGKSKGRTCIKRTKDGGKQCRKESDCDSLCLARSGTCAPVKPLFGCNEILQDDGRRVTLCID